MVMGLTWATDERGDAEGGEAQARKIFEEYHGRSCAGIP